jgi:hypothetical protein
MAVMVEGIVITILLRVPNALAARNVRDRSTPSSRSDAACAVLRLPHIPAIS